MIKKYIAYILALIALAALVVYFVLVSSGISFEVFSSSVKNEYFTYNKLSSIVTKLICNEDQVFEKGFCRNINQTCSDGSIILRTSECKIQDVDTSTISDIDNSTTTEEVATSTIKTSVTPKPSSVSVPVVQVPVDTTPKITKVTITPNSNKGILISIWGSNFDKTLNTVSVVTNTGVTKKLEMLSYPVSGKVRLINFNFNYPTVTFSGEYSFQIFVNDKSSNIFKVWK